MGKKSTSTWFVHLAHQKKGPLTIHQLYELLDNGEIKGDAKVSISLDAPALLSVSEVLKIHSDPTDTLFDVLQNVRRKKPESNRSLSPGNERTAWVESRRPPKKLWITLILLLVLVGIGGFLFFFQSNPKTSDEATTSQDSIPNRAPPDHSDPRTENLTPSVSLPARDIQPANSSSSSPPNTSSSNAHSISPIEPAAPPAEQPSTAEFPPGEEQQSFSQPSSEGENGAVSQDPGLQPLEPNGPPPSQPQEGVPNMNNNFAPPPQQQPSQQEPGTTAQTNSSPPAQPQSQPPSFPIQFGSTISNP